MGFCPTILGPASEQAKELLRNEIDSQDKGHVGLIFDRYLPLWGDETNDNGDVVERFKWVKEPSVVLAQFANMANQDSESRQQLLGQVLARQEALVVARNGQSKTHRLTSPLILGLGLSHPTGNGFLFDPVVGVPWLPGTAVKGLCRQGARLTGATDEEILRLLGPEPESEMPDTGALVFLDAWPTQWPSLQVQVMTPHYSSYYSAMREDKRKRRRFWDDPHGLDDPVPIHFLSVAENTDYGFGILPRTGGEDGIETAFEWLEYALELLGAGGKTAVGFGVFTPAK